MAVTAAIPACGLSAAFLPATEHRIGKIAEKPQPAQAKPASVAGTPPVRSAMPNPAAASAPPHRTVATEPRRAWNQSPRSLPSAIDSENTA